MFMYKSVILLVQQVQKFGKKQNQTRLQGLIVKVLVSWDHCEILGSVFAQNKKWFLWQFGVANVFLDATYDVVPWGYTTKSALVDASSKGFREICGQWH